MRVVYTVAFFRRWLLLLGSFFGLLWPCATLFAADTLPSGRLPNDPFWRKQWYLRQIHAPEAWEMATGSRQIVVAVIDGGVDVTHPDLQDNIWINPREVAGDGIDNDQNGYIDDVHGWNFVTNSRDVGPIPSRNPQAEESWSHGTFVASLIGAEGNNGLGMAGVAWRVQLMPLVVLDGDGFGNMQTMIRAIRYAIDQRVDIINLSLSGNEYNPELEIILKEAYDKGIFVVAATGNDESSETGVNTDEQPIYPVCMDADENTIFGVGGTDTLDQKAPYANFGHACTDLVAPAQEFFGARPSYRRPTDTSTTTGFYLEGMTGTSLSAPLVSGAAVLLKSVRPELTPTQIADLLRNNADPIEANLHVAERGRMGSGRLNIGRALSQLTPVSRESVALFTQSSQGGVVIQSALLQNQWRSWTHQEPVPVMRWLSTSTNPEALALVATTSTWTREIWQPAFNRVSSTVWWRKGEGVPAPRLNAAETRALVLRKTAKGLVAEILDPITNRSQRVPLPQAWGRGEVELAWWEARSSWVLWSTTGQGVLLDERGKIVATIRRTTKGMTTSTMHLQVPTSKEGLELRQGTRPISKLQLHER